MSWLQQRGTRVSFALLRRMLQAAAALSRRCWLALGGTFVSVFRSKENLISFMEVTMRKFIAAALLSVAVVGGPAYAQTPQSADPAAPTATTKPTDSNTKMMLKGNWRASKLMGLDVYNEANEKLGDINELILDKNGRINAVVIGVGGFLGMGEHDIAVSMDKLKFVEEPVRTSSTAPATTARDTTTGAAPTTTAGTSAANDWMPDHAVMSGTKDQLKTMPQFKYSDYN
jgi:sporulation protein YlmC with PRC-barrel domain